MSKPFSTTYTLCFIGAVCLVCSLLVSSLAVGLKPRQQENIKLDVKKNVLLAAGLAKAGESLSRDEIEARFASVTAVVIDLATGEETDVDPETFDQARAVKDPATSKDAPKKNPAKVKRVPNQAKVFKVFDEQGSLSQIVLPIEGKGLWSTMYGFLSLDADCETVRGITFYAHGETPGLGGEIDNPKWKAKWPKRKVYDDSGAVVLSVMKGTAGTPEDDPFHVDGISGATLTCRGVNGTVEFWLGPDGFKPYLDRLKK